MLLGRVLPANPISIVKWTSAIASPNCMDLLPHMYIGIPIGHTIILRLHPKHFLQIRLTAGPGRDVPVLGTGRDKTFFYNPGPSHMPVKKPGPVPYHQSRTRAHPISSFGFPVLSHPIPVMGPGRDGMSRATDILVSTPQPGPGMG